jgi:hypothetical protein
MGESPYTRTPLLYSTTCWIPSPFSWHKPDPSYLCNLLLVPINLYCLVLDPKFLKYCQLLGSNSSVAGVGHQPLHTVLLLQIPNSLYGHMLVPKFFVKLCARSSKRFKIFQKLSLSEVNAFRLEITF